MLALCSCRIEPIGQWIKYSVAVSEGLRRAWPQQSEPSASLVDAPAATATLDPDGCQTHGIDVSGVRLLRRLTHLKCLYGCYGKVVEGAEDIADLRFDHVDCRVVPEARVGTVQHEHVRESMYGCERMGHHAIGPSCRERDAIVSEDSFSEWWTRGEESGGENNHI